MVFKKWVYIDSVMNSILSIMWRHKNMTVQSAIISLIGAIISGIMATIITLYVNHTTEIKRNKKELTIFL